MSPGKHTNEPKHKQIKPRFWTARWSVKSGPRWGASAAMITISIAGLIKGLDLALDPTTDGEVFAYANLFGTDAWGTVQAVTSAAALISILCRWQAGLIISLGTCMTIWGMYAAVIAQAVLPRVFEDGGLRTVTGAATHSVLFLLTFMISVRQYRIEAVDEVGR